MTTANRQTVFIVDDDEAVRDSIAELVGSVGLQAECYGSAPAFIETFTPERPGCLVLDVRMAEMSGLDLQQELIERGNRIPVIFLTGHGDVPVAVRAMKAGAVDFLQKPYRDQALLDAIHQALSLKTANGDPANTAPNGIAPVLAALTAREREVLEQVQAGKTSHGIAEALNISPRTAEVHRRNVLRKLGFSSTRELVASLSDHD